MESWDLLDTAVNVGIRYEDAIVFLTLAAGSILDVVVQLITLAGTSTRRHALYVGLLAGLAMAFLTGMIVTAGGA
jgi:ZIP family zinc transporter